MALCIGNLDFFFYELLHWPYCVISNNCLRDWTISWQNQLPVSWFMSMWLNIQAVAGQHLLTHLRCMFCLHWQDHACTNKTEIYVLQCIWCMFIECMCPIPTRLSMCQQRFIYLFSTCYSGCASYWMNFLLLKNFLFFKFVLAGCQCHVWAITRSYSTQFVS